MQLTASPFDATTGALLPVYRDAYLRGDLSQANTTAVDAYLKTNRTLSDDTLLRFHTMKVQGEAVRPVGWVQRQMDLIRTEPQRFRRRAATLVTGALLVAGASMAASTLPTVSAEPVDVTADASMAPMRMVTVRGRILNENGQPLVGATVLDRKSGRGTGTDADGNYALMLPATTARQLQFGYGGYAEEDVAVNGQLVQNMTLLPRERPVQAKHHRWLFF